MKNKTFAKINFIYYIAMILVAIIFLLGYSGILPNNNFMDMVVTIFIQVIVMFAIPLLLYTTMVRRNLKSTFRDFGFKSISGNMILISIALGFVLYFINSFVASAFSGFITLLGYENLGSSVPISVNYNLLIKDFIFSAVFPGVFEEFLHRGLLLHAGKKCGNTRYCLIISSILFGLMHLSITKFFYTAILGFLMGYVAIVSDSIYPTMIIHIMNNALASYFVYGRILRLPLATFIYEFEMALFGNIFVFITVSVIGVFALIHLYLILTRLMYHERAKSDMKKVIEYLKLNNLTLTQAQEKVDQINEIISASKSLRVPTGNKFSFTDKIFLYSSIVLGSLITISSYIWGII